MTVGDRRTDRWTDRRTDIEEEHSVGDKQTDKLSTVIV